jgi:hypothetical protein
MLERQDCLFLIWVDSGALVLAEACRKEQHWFEGKTMIQHAPAATSTNLRNKSDTTTEGGCYAVEG